MITTERKAKRVRCAGPCDALFDPGDLAYVGPSRRLCQECMIAEASELAGVQPVDLPDRKRILDQLPNVNLPNDVWPARYGRLSPSEIGTFMACPEKWRKQKILGHREPSDGKKIAGNAAHAAVEAFWTHKLHGETLPSTVVRATARAAFDDQVEQEMGKKGDRLIDWQEPMTLTVARDATEYMSAAYIERVGETMIPLSMEAVTVVTVPGVPVPVVSIADLIRADFDRDGEMIPAAIVDYKFGKNAYKTHTAWWTTQGLIQQLGRDLACEWHSINYSGEVNTPEEWPALRVERSEQRYVIAAELVRTMYRSVMMMLREFGPYNVWPGARANPSTCGMCAFTNDCSWWTGEEWLEESDLGI